jgi:hypothetical protein
VKGRDRAYPGSTKSVMTPTSSLVPGRTYAVMSNSKARQFLQEVKGSDSYLNLSEDTRVFRLVCLCNSLRAEKSPFLCRVPGRNIRAFLSPESMSYQWNSISFTGSNPTEINTLYASRIVTVPDP